MIKNYFKIAWRNLIRHRAFTLLNISGLAVGIASCLLLFCVLKYELSYKRSQPNYNRIYHVVTEDKTPDDVFYNPGIPFPAMDALRLKFPEIITGALYASYGSQVTVLGDRAENNSQNKFIEQTGFFFCDPQFFEVFHYDWLAGSPADLKQPNVTVLTEKIASKYFGDWHNAIGKFLKLDNAVTVKVTGILKDVPANTDYPLQIVSSFETVKSHPDTYFYSTEWGATTSNFQLFMLLPKNLSAAQVNSQLVDFSQQVYAKSKSDNSIRTNFLEPLPEVHFDKRFDSFGDHVIEKSTLWTLALIGVFILIMACINFINLSTAQAVSRSREIGIRKVLGGYRWQLFRQVMLETALMVFISIIAATAIAALCLPYLEKIAFIPEPLNLYTSNVMLFLGCLLVLVTVFAGFYPAMILSGFKPALALKNKVTSATIGGISLRRVLVVSQFAISQVLIIGTIIAVSQMNFVKNADLGFNKEALLILNANNDSIAQSRQESFKQNLLQLPGVQVLSFRSDVPSSENNSGTNFGFDHKPDPPFTLYTKFADEDYFKTFGLTILAGRGFQRSDTIKEVVINEMLMKKLGIQEPEQVIGKVIKFGGRGEWKTICGVVKDFKTNSLKENIKPLAIAERRNRYQVAAVKLRSSNIPKTRAAVEAAWNKMYPEYAFTSSYMDDNIAEFYKQDQQLSLLYKIFAGIAIFISCLGLYGLVSYMAIQKTREIGVRKVLGASVKSIIFLFSKEFTILILVGSAVAVPVAYYMMNNWLQNFVFRIKINPLFFVMAILISIVIAWIAVGYKSIKAALANPVSSLKSE